MCDLYADERAEVWDRTFPRAKKEYRCECCDAMIRVGTKYVRTFIVFEGEASTAKSCVACNRDINKFGKEHNYWPWPNGFVEYLNNCIDEEPEEAAPWKRILVRIKARREASA